MTHHSPAMLFVRQDAAGEEILRQLKIQPGRPLIFLIAGAKYTSPENQLIIQNSVNATAAAAQKLGAIVIDGGTNAGPMGLLNDALAAQDFAGPYLGFLPAFSASRAAEVDTAKLGQSHTHFVLVDGEHYGAERVPMYNTVEILSRSSKACGVILNGGLLAANEVRTAVGLGLPLVVVPGSGRLADELAAPKHAGEILAQGEAEKLRDAGEFVFVGGGEVESIIEEILGEN